MFGLKFVTRAVHFQAPGVNGLFKVATRQTIQIVSGDVGQDVKGAIPQQSQLTQFRGEAVFVDKLHKSVEQMAADALPQNNDRKFQIADKIAPPHPARLTAKAVQPLATDVLGPLRRTRNHSTYDL